MEYDQRRTTTLKATGIEVLRFWDDDALKDTDIVAETILEACERRVEQQTPSPASPSPNTPGEPPPSSSSPGTPGEAG